MRACPALLALAEAEGCDGADPCCLHDYRHNGKRKRVCCWCGDLYEPEDERTKHGEYAPRFKEEVG